MKTEKISDILSSATNFEKLLHKVLLFNKDSKYDRFSGPVTAALLDFDDPENKISILAIQTSIGWLTFRYSRNDLTEMLSSCIEAVGNTPEESFTFTHD